MSTSYNTEMELRELATSLRQDADHLEQAADILCALRESKHLAADVASAKRAAKEWLKRHVR